MVVGFVDTTEAGAMKTAAEEVGVPIATASGVVGVAAGALFFVLAARIAAWAMIVASGEPESTGLVLPDVAAGAGVVGCCGSGPANGKTGCVTAPPPRTEAIRAAPVRSAWSFGETAGEETGVETVAVLDEEIVAGIARGLNREKGTNESELPFADSLAFSMGVSRAGVAGSEEALGFETVAGVADWLSHSKSESG